MNKAKYWIDRENGIIHVDFPNDQHRAYGYKHPDKGWTEDWKEIFEQRIKEFQESDEFILCDELGVSSDMEVKHK